MVCALAICSERPCKVARLEQGDVVPDALRLHLVGECLQRRVDLVKLAREALLEAGVMVEAAEREEEDGALLVEVGAGSPWRPERTAYR